MKATNQRLQFRAVFSRGALVATLMLGGTGTSVLTVGPQSQSWGPADQLVSWRLTVV